MEEQKQKTASEMMKATFNTSYRKLMRYCDWVFLNQQKLDMHNKLMGYDKEQNDFMEGIPTMPLRMNL